MGVPSLFRWLSKKYPKILKRVEEELPQIVDGVEVPVDATKDNPNGEVDHLYLDMNGIVHPCSHPEDKPAPENEEEMMVAVFEYTDRVIRMVRPRKLLMIAVDGVAPRAKMNQQRQRRFRSVKEAKEKAEQKEEFNKLLKAQNGRLEEEEPKKAWDSNVITPGTPFMTMLAECLQYWTQYKIATDEAWKDLKVIISDASVPGEGEHKIMEFIRSQRSSPGYDPNTRHVIYGLDADLIMLALATHEPHFRVLREDVFFNKDRVCNVCREPGHNSRECPGPNSNATSNLRELMDRNLKPFMWLQVSVLREYLKVEMDSPGRNFEYDFERALDDWVFMCFFVGNDFLPHLPSLEINENGIDTLIDIWRNVIGDSAGYVTNNGRVNMLSVQKIMRKLALKEARIFQTRKHKEDQYQKRMADRAAGDAARAAQALKRKRQADNGAPGAGAPSFKRVKETAETYTSADVMFFDPKDAQSQQVRAFHHDLVINKSGTNKSAASAMREVIQASASAQPPAPVESTTNALETDSGTPGLATPVSNNNGNGTSAQGPPEDTVKLWEEGYQDRYYVQKFHVDASDKEFRHEVARHYVLGLCWVLQYYMQGCPDWTWYYPYHYPPFAEDFVNVAEVRPKFSSGVPFQPYQQLMGVLPAASRHAVPEVYHSLMTDPDSEIIDFYPETFEVDLNGAKQAWKGVALLPFIDQDRLKKAMAPKDKLLKPDEDKRNQPGNDFLIFHESQPMFPAIMKAWNTFPVPKTVKLDPSLTGGFNGEVMSDDKFVLNSRLVFPLETANPWDDIPEQPAVRVLYIQPTYKKPHKSILLPGLKEPDNVLTDQDTHALKSHGNNTYRGTPKDLPDGFVPTREDLRWGSQRPFPNPNNGGGGRGFRSNRGSGGLLHAPYYPPGPPVSRPDFAKLPGDINVEALFNFEKPEKKVNKNEYETFVETLPKDAGVNAPVRLTKLAAMFKAKTGEFPQGGDSYRPDGVDSYRPDNKDDPPTPRSPYRGLPADHPAENRRFDDHYDSRDYHDGGRGIDYGVDRGNSRDSRRDRGRDGGRGRDPRRDENWRRRDDGDNRRDNGRYNPPGRYDRPNDRHNDGGYRRDNSYDGRYDPRRDYKETRKLVAYNDIDEEMNSTSKGARDDYPPPRRGNNDPDLDY